jgi:F-box protein 21
MKVDELNKGRNQPFYHVLVNDGTVRYVAEENVVPIKPSDDELIDLMKLAGRYFRKYDRVRGSFVSNVKTEFPDD